MAFGLDDAVLGWLADAAGDFLVRSLRGDPARRALRRVVDRAVAETVAEVAGHLTSEQTERLRSVLRERDVLMSCPQVGSLPELRVVLRTWTAALDYPEYGEPGYLAQLGLDADQLSEELTTRVEAGVRRSGRTGGPLEPLAKWLRSDELYVDVGDVKRYVGDIKRELAEHRGAVEPQRVHGGGLPGGTPEFTGRLEELGELARRVEAHEPAGSVLAIHSVDGMPGVGKTELVLRAAHEHKHRYPDGQYFIDLYGHTEGIPPVSPEAGLAELLRQAGVPGQAIPPDLAGLQARWRALMARQRALVVLDDASDVAQARPLLPMSAGCLVLITSRSRLTGLPGAKALPLDVLFPPEAVELFIRLAGADRCPDRDTVAIVVGLVGHLPVAVHAVAGQMRDGLSVAELAHDLADAKARNGLVAEASPLGAGVYAAFETSVQRLDEATQLAFRLLGVHPGPIIGVPQFAAIAGIPAGQARATLRGLADRNLIKPAGSRVGHPRYGLHDLIREFVRRQAESHFNTQERSLPIARLTTWYGSALDLVERLWDAPGTQPPPAPGVEGLNLTGATQARTWVAAEQENLIAFAELVTDASAAHICYRSARRLYLLHQYASARALFRSARGIYRQLDDRRGEADTLRGLGDVARVSRDYPAAAEQYRAALVIYRQLEGQPGEPDTLRGLGEVARFTGDHVAAIEHYRAALVGYQQVDDDRIGAAGAVFGLGVVALNNGYYQEATELISTAMAGFVRAGDRNGVAVAMNGTGALALVTGEYVIAERQFRNAVRFFQQTGDVSGEANASWGLGNATYAQGRRDEASEWWDKAIALYSQLGNPFANKVRTESQRLGRSKGGGEADLTNTPSEKP